MPDDQIEEHVGLTQPDAFEQTTSGESVTTKRLYADGGHGQEKEVVTLDSRSGASSDAPPSSGIPSAKTQHGLSEVTAPQDETPMGERVQPARPSSEA